MLLRISPSRLSTVIIGEVGLAGEVRRVTGTPRRLAEAARLCFTHAIVAHEPGTIPAGIKVYEAADIRAAIDAAFKVPGRPGSR